MKDSEPDSNISCDVLIAGGGVAGVAAACAAAAAGASVVLVERYGFLGGLASSASVGTICGIYERRSKDFKFAVGRFPAHFATEVRARTGLHPILLKDGLACLPTTPVAMADVCAALTNSATVKTFTHSTLFEVVVSQQRISSARFMCGFERFRVDCAAVVDTSGDALVSIFAKLPTLACTESQAASFSMQVNGVVSDCDEASLSREVALIAMRSFENVFASVTPGSTREGNTLIKISTGETPRNATETIRLEQKLRSRAGELLTILRKEDSSFANARMIALTPQLGTRAGMRPRGRKTLSFDDISSGKRTADGVAVGCWPAEEWLENGTVKMTPVAGGSYLIPADALRSCDCENIWFGGRSISADEKAMASARAIGTALGTGYAAGYLAASHTKRVPEAEAVHSLRREQELE